MRGRGGRKGPNPLTRSYESNGGDVKIRGTALHIAEKYVQLARDAQSGGDRVAAENYLQHAEHYYRILAAAQAQMPQPQPVFRSDDEGDEDEDREGRPNGHGERQPMPQAGQPAFGGADPQPYVNGNGQGEPDDEASRPMSADEARFEPNENFADRGNFNRDSNYPRDNQTERGGGGYRGRRRRPFRDRYSGERGGEQAAPPSPATEAPPGDD
jgi:hypothetical protein